SCLFVVSVSPPASQPATLSLHDALPIFPGLLGEVLPGGIQLEAVLLGEGVKVHPGDAVPPDVVPAAGLDGPLQDGQVLVRHHQLDRKSTRLNSSHVSISYAVFCLKKKRK